MDTRRFRIGAAAALLVINGAGCSNLVVKKVPIDKRMAGSDDHLKGFRYYLNRPYLLVNDKILLKENKSLVMVQKTGTADEILLKYLDGPRRDQTVKVSNQKVTTNGGAVSTVTPSELAKLKAILVSQNEARASRSATTPKATRAIGRDDAVQRTQHAATDPKDTGAATTPASSQTPAQTANVAINIAGGATLGGTGVPGQGFGAGAPALQPPASFGADVKPIPIPDVGKPAVHGLTGNMKILYLPDLDEQYVIKSKNVLAKSAFALTFNDDSSLAAVEGNHDATTVTISLLEQVDKAITAAQGVLGAQITQQSKTTTAAPNPAGLGTGAPGGLGAAAEIQYYQFVERIYIRPGLYRLNKPWEMGGDQAETVGCGLLAKLGIPYVTETELVPSE